MKTKNTALPKVVTRAKWLVARNKLLAKEKAATRARDALNAERRRSPMVRIEKDYVFDGPDGKASLLDLFEGRHQLIIYHFMYHAHEDRFCDGCSFFADQISHLEHLHARDTSFALVARAPLAKIKAFKKRMGWKVPWFSSFRSDFNYDFGVTTDEGETFGLSVFLRNGDEILHTTSRMGVALSI
jgi:predicted dithiol-disulfide oxidoreductase (DUF899 family)